MCFYECSKLNNLPFLAALHYLRISWATNLLLVSWQVSPFPLAWGTQQVAKSRCGQARHQVQYRKLFFTHSRLMTDVHRSWFLTTVTSHWRSAQPNNVCKLHRFQHWIIHHWEPEDTWLSSQWFNPQQCSISVCIFKYPPLQFLHLVFLYCLPDSKKRPFYHSCLFSFYLTFLRRLKIFKISEYIIP